MERARAKRIATALMGVAFAANCWEPANAQTANRFIRQPSKAQTPTTVAPAATVNQAPIAAIPTQTATGSAENTQAAPAMPTQPVAGQATTQAAPELVLTNGTEGSSKSFSDNVPAARKDSKNSIFTPFAFPSLTEMSTTPDIEFDSSESFATVPEVTEDATEQSNIQFTDFAKLPQSQGEALSSSLPSKPQGTSQPSASRSNQLQWTSRATNRNPSLGSSGSNSGSSNSTPTFQNDHIRSQDSFNSRLNTTSQASLNHRDSSGAADSTSDLLQRIATRVDAIESKFDKTEVPAEQARTRASLVSAHITNDPRFAVKDSSQSTVTRIESPQGWQAIGARLSSHVTKCESLLRRGAYCSAQEEAETAAMLLLRHIDLHDNLFRCEPALQSANQALREAEDFLVVLKGTSDGEAIRRLVDAHETAVLKSKNLVGMSPLTAAQHYRQFAEAQLTEAAQGHPWASELLYTIGRTYHAEADANSVRVDALRMKAIAYYRAARITLPSNAVACNQLGYLLLQMDRNEEAREALVAAVKLKPDEAALSNLAEASRRLGDTQTVQWANQSVAAIRRRLPPPTPVPPYMEVSQEEFIAISPREIGPKSPSNSGQNAASQPPIRSAATPNASQMR